MSLNDQATGTGPGGLCLQAAFDVFTYYYYRKANLNYTVCTDGDLGHIYGSQRSRSFWDGHGEEDMAELRRLLELPLGQVPRPPPSHAYSHALLQRYLATLPGGGAGGGGRERNATKK